MDNDELDDFADDLAAEWHETSEDGTPLYEYMKMSSKEYATWVTRNEYPSDWRNRFDEKNADSK